MIRRTLIVTAAALAAVCGTATTALADTGWGW